MKRVVLVLVVFGAGLFGLTGCESEKSTSASSSGGGGVQSGSGGQSGGNNAKAGPGRLPKAGESPGR